MAGFDYRALDNIIHSRVRLAIMSYLMTAKSADFNELKSQLNLSDGNLSTHLTKLETIDYIKLEKKFVGKKPLTTVTITTKGNNAFKTYIEQLSTLIEKK